MCKIKLYESHTPVLLAGGMGTRLRSVLGEIPKPIARVKGKPFISILLNQLEREGFNTAIISTGYKEKYIRECLSEENHNLKIIYSHETKPLGTGGAIKHAANQVETEKILAMNADSILEVDKCKILDEIENEYDFMVCNKMKLNQRYGNVEINSQGMITKMMEKEYTPAIYGYINTGIYSLRTEKIAMESKSEFSLEKYFLQEQIRKKKLKGIQVEANFIDIGIPEDFQKSQDLEWL